jgi:hypothetical protein
MPERLPARLPPEPLEGGRRTLQSAVRLLFDYAKRHAPPPRQRPPRPDLPRPAGRYHTAIQTLKAIPAILLAAFALSFFFDWDGLVRTLAVGGLIGFGTNWLAIKMLFHPREERGLVGQGLIPAQRERVIHRLAVAVSDKLINPETIRRKIEESQIIPRYREVSVGVARSVIEDPGFRADLRALATQYARDALGDPRVRRQIVAFTVDKIESAAGGGLAGFALKAYRAVGEEDFLRRLDEAVASLPDAVDRGIEAVDVQLDALPDLIERHAHDLEAWATTAILDIVDRIDTYELVRDSMRRFDETQLEDLLMKTSNEQMQYIQYLGGILGVFGGIAIWQPIWGTLGLAAGVALLWGVDELLTRRKRARAPQLQPDTEPQAVAEAQSVTEPGVPLPSAPRTVQPSSIPEVHDSDDDPPPVSRVETAPPPTAP